MIVHTVEAILRDLINLYLNRLSAFSYSEPKNNNGPSGLLETIVTHVAIVETVLGVCVDGLKSCTKILSVSTRWSTLQS